MRRVRKCVWHPEVLYQGTRREHSYSRTRVQEVSTHSAEERTLRIAKEPQKWVSNCLGFLFWYGRMFSRISPRTQNVFPVVASSLRSQVNHLFTWKKSSRHISSSPSFLLLQSVNVSLFVKYFFTERRESDENKVPKENKMTWWVKERTSEWV